MDDNKVQFEEWHPPQRQAEPTKIVRLLMKLSGGAIKNEKQANFVLIVILVVVIIATILIWTAS